MNLYNFQISQQFLAPPTENGHSEPLGRVEGARWKLRKMVEVPYPEAHYSFPEGAVMDKLLRVVKVPYPQPNPLIPNSAAPDPLERPRESGLGSNPVERSEKSHHRTLGFPWREPMSYYSTRLRGSRIQKNPSTP